MTTKRTTTVPTMKFGSGRSGTLLLSVGKRGRITFKGEASFNLVEAHAFLSQVGWFFEQVSMAGPAGGSVSRPTILAHASPQLDLYTHPLMHDAASVAGSASGK